MRASPDRALEATSHDFVARDVLLHVLLGVSSVLDAAHVSTQSMERAAEPDWEMADVLLGLLHVTHGIGLDATTTTARVATRTPSTWSRSDLR